MGELQSSPRKVNYQFKIIYAVGMVMLLAAHGADGGVSMFYDWFAPQHCILPLFMFSSGYFFSDRAADNWKKFAWKKTKSMLIPLYLWNLFYAAVVLILQPAGFTIGTPVTLSKLFVEPITTGHQFAYNLAGWFVIPLYMITLFVSAFRKLFRRIENIVWKETVVLIIFQCLGFLGVWIASTGRYEGWWLVLVRFLFLLPFFAWGTFYKQVLEERDTLPSLAYFAIVFIFREITIQLYGDGTFPLWAWMSNMDYGLFAMYLILLPGIAFWLRISRILEPAIGRSKVVNAIADNSFSIMVNHLFAFMIVKFIIYALFRFTPLCQGFDCDAFRTDIWYLYSPFYENRTTILYVVAGLAIPIGMQKMVNLGKRKLFRKA